MRDSTGFESTMNRTAYGAGPEVTEFEQQVTGVRINDEATWVQP